VHLSDGVWHLKLDFRHNLSSKCEQNPVPESGLLFYDCQGYQNVKVNLLIAYLFHGSLRLLVVTGNDLLLLPMQGVEGGKL